MLYMAYGHRQTSVKKRRPLIRTMFQHNLRGTKITRRLDRGKNKFRSMFASELGAIFLSQLSYAIVNATVFGYMSSYLGVYRVRNSSCRMTISRDGFACAGGDLRLFGWVPLEYFSKTKVQMSLWTITPEVK
ncbi:hypothetical protein PV325_004683 [Microctonus aethiopoides]|nr:hypothetical protein PV325_004683 [Microctonus aethiopoides]